MNGRSEAMLQVTGEKVVVLNPAGATTGGQGRYLCLLPPQQSWHRPRIQEIRAERLQFRNTR